MEMNPHTASLSLAIALAIGIIGQIFSRPLKIPGVILLLGLGVALGPDALGVLHPAGLGKMLQMIVGSSVAIILFEGGLQLELKRIKKEALTIRRLITWGPVITTACSAIAAKTLLGWGWPLSFLFGTLVIVTGPTVVTPILRRIRVNKNISTILEAEGVLIDPVGAVIAVVALEVFLKSGADAYLVGISSVFFKLAFGLVVGFVFGWVLKTCLKSERFVPRELENIFTLGFVIFSFEISNWYVHESGIMTVTIAGMVVGNAKIPAERRIIEFKEQLTTMLIGFLFVMLSADVRLSDIQALGTNGLWVVAAIMFVARPLNVIICSWGSGSNWRDQFFMSWLAPRGIVAAAIASLFAFDLQRYNKDGGDELRALVFLVITVTVVLQGLTAGPLAALLKVRRKQNHGFVIVGANIIGRTLAKLLLRNPDTEVIMIDSSPSECSTAQDEGLRVFYGNGLEESLLLRAHVDTRRAVIGTVPNNGVNLMLARKVKEVAREVEVMISTNQGGSISEKEINSLEAQTLFVKPHDYQLWISRLQSKSALISTWRYTGIRNLPLIDLFQDDDLDAKSNGWMVFACQRTQTVLPASQQTVLKTNDCLLIAIHKPTYDFLKEAFEKHELQELVEA